MADDSFSFGNPNQYKMPDYSGMNMGDARKSGQQNWLTNSLQQSAGNTPYHIYGQDGYYGNNQFGSKYFQSKSMMGRPMRYSPTEYAQFNPGGDYHTYARNFHSNITKPYARAGSQGIQDWYPQYQQANIQRRAASQAQGNLLTDFINQNNIDPNVVKNYG